MATSVFGAPMTQRTLANKEDNKCREVTTRYLAELAFLAKNDGRDAKAREFLEERRTKYVIEFTLCLIYNATGDTIRLQTYSDAGDGFVSPSPYPMLIMNGQWGAYLKRGGGAVVYAVKNEGGSEFQVVYTYWSLEPGRVYTEIKQRDFYKPKDPWSNYVTPLTANTSYIYQDHKNGLSSFATLGGTTKSPVFEGIITLDGAWPNYSKVNPCYSPYKALIGTVGSEVEGTAGQAAADDSDASMATDQK